MESIQILENGYYLPEKVIQNVEMASKFKITEKEIYEKTGIQKRYRKQDESIEEMAYRAVKNLLEKIKMDINKIDMILVATTSSKRLMPGISYDLQKKLEIPNCICLDLLAGCSGFINAFDIARNYIAIGKIQYALIVGVEALSEFTDTTDVNTEILFSDGAGATLLGRADKSKQYGSLLQSNGEKGDILTCYADTKIQMDGKAIYKYAVTDTVKNIRQLLEQEKEELKHIKYIIPHQSNIRIMERIAEKLELPKEKLYTNIKEVGNSFCASIPIALNEMFNKGLLQQNDKIILLGYGGGLNLGSILMEV